MDLQRELSIDSGQTYESHRTKQTDQKPTYIINPTTIKNDNRNDKLKQRQIRKQKGTNTTLGRVADSLDAPRDIKREKRQRQIIRQNQENCEHKPT